MLKAPALYSDALQAVMVLLVCLVVILKLTW